MMRPKASWALWAILAFMLVGGVFRFYNLNWDLYHSFHPDERNILGQTAGIQKADGFRVRFFAYGQLPVYLYRATAEAVSVPKFFTFVTGGRVNNTVVGLWWVTLALLLGTLFWLARKEAWKVPVVGTAVVVFAALVFLDLFPVFNIWFRNLDPIRSKIACLLFVSAAAFGASLAVARYLETDWFGKPFYSAAGITFLCGALPMVLPWDAFARVFGLMAFTFILFAGLSWWAWISRVGRFTLLALTAWVFLAAQPNPGPHFIDYKYMMVIGRWWSALFSTLTIGGIYLLVKRIYQNTPMALVAAGAFAGAVVSIQYAHYCVTESFITFMVVAMAYTSASVLEKGTWKSYLIAGACFGLAMAAKTSAMFYVLMLVAAHLVRMAKRPAAAWQAEDRRNSGNVELTSLAAGLLLVAVPAGFLFAGMKLRGIIRDLYVRDPATGPVVWTVLFVVLAAAGLLFFAYGLANFKALRGQMAEWTKVGGALGLSFLLFCALSPWSLVDNQGFMHSQQYEWGVVSISDACYVHQFKDTPRYLFHLQNLMHVELWWPLGIMAVAGMAWVLLRFGWRLARPVKGAGLLPVPFLKGRSFRFEWPDLLLLAWFIPYFGFIGHWNTKFVRYMIPLIPFFCIFAARLLMDLTAWLSRRWASARVLGAVLAALVLGSTFFYATAYMAVYRNPHPWIEASVWMFKNIPEGSTILKEHWDDGLPTGIEPWMDPRVTRSMGPHNYRQEDIPVYEMFGHPTDDTPVKKNNYADLLERGQYISIASKKLWYTLTDSSPEFRPKGFNKYPVTSRYYRALWTGLLGYKMVAEINNFPRLFGWVHPDDMAEESFSVYDHPRVYVFKKVEDVPRERILELLSTDDYVRGVRRGEMRQVLPGNVDDFIARHRAKLEKEGLWARLMGASTAPSTVVPAATPEKQGRSERKSPVAAGALKPTGTPPPPTASAPAVEAPRTVPGLPGPATMEALKKLSADPVVVPDTAALPPDSTESLPYQLRAWFSWLLLLMVLGWLALPLTLRILAPMGEGAYSLSKFLGMIVFTWAVWASGSYRILKFTQANCWIWLILLAAGTVALAMKDKTRLSEAWRRWGRSWSIQEGAFILAFALFTLVRIHNPHIHDPGGEGYSGGGEAGMDFGFLASVVRGDSFPPQNQWMAGLPIGYSFYLGHLMMGVLTKTLGLVPAVTYNLAVITLFASIFAGAFGIAVALSGRLLSGWVAGFLCAAAGNLAGAKQYLKVLQECILRGSLRPLTSFTFDYWGPSRVIPNSINEFPYFSVLFADMHAHTLAQPFALLLVAVIGSWFMAKTPLTFRTDWPLFGLLALLVGSLTFFNTWELPPWMVLLVLALLIKHLQPVREKILLDAAPRFLFSVTGALLLLNWFSLALKGIDPLVLGAETKWFAAFLLLGLAAAFVWLYLTRSTRPLTLRLLAVSGVVAGVVAAAVLLWLPRFIGFAPQQNEVLWVNPKLRTALGNYLTIYGVFLTVLLLGFLPVYGDALLRWIGTVRAARAAKRPARKRASSFDPLEILDRWAMSLRVLVAPRGPVAASLVFGAGILLAVAGASLLHFSQPAGRLPLAYAAATLTFGLFAAAWFTRSLALTGAGAVALLAWLGLYATRTVEIFDDHPFSLGLALHAVLWLTAFFFIGLAVKTFKSDRRLSFAYLLTSMVFLITAALEVFVMREYLGGDWMRNNSLFKFGIVAWELAAVATGALLPRVLDFGRRMLSAAVRSEGPSPRKVLMAVSWLFVLAGIAALTSEFKVVLRNDVVYWLDLVLIAAGAWWLRDEAPRPLVIAVAVLLGVWPLLAVLPLSPSGFQGALDRAASAFSAGILLSAVLAGLVIWSVATVVGERRDLGRVTAAFSWKALFILLLALVAVYPLAGSWRKCHGFLPAWRAARMGYAESPTLNGLAYIKKTNPADAAAIRFLNERVPGQPCLVETVGIGYNSWGSRYSIFTGIPALMGWDGHVREWVGHLPGMSQDITQRYQATESIFNTTDRDHAKRLMDAFGVRLVMVGPLERGKLDHRKSFSADGLAKFEGWLPLVYRNPGVEVYYNPPGALPAVPSGAVVQ